jgi:4-amino-4-deoxy-L-arabinose transferase-like glycosyltransferase
MTSRRALWGLIAVSGLFRLGLGASLGLGNDEAYHYLFTVHPAWSYYDHPPMVAAVEALGLILAGGHVSELSLRLGFIALFAGSTWLMARLTTRFYGVRAGWFAALALNLTAYHSVAAGAFALPDGPLLFFWLLTLDRLAAALEPGPSARLVPWIWVGLAWGCGLLSKYHAVFLPLGTLLYLVLEPAARGWLRRRGPYLALGIGLLLFTPVLAWNARHGWVSFLFQGGRALGELVLRPDTLLTALLGQAVYLLPWIWVWLVWILFCQLRKLRDLGPADRFLLCQAIVPLALFTLVACTRPVMPHWTLVGFLSLFPMLGHAWQGRCETRPRFARRLVLMAGGLLLAIGLGLLQTHWGLIQKGGHGRLGLLRVSRDPTLDLYGWDQVAAELKRRGLFSDPGTFVFTSAWYQSGHLAFALRGTAMPVLCYSSWDARGFAFWSRSADWVGHDGILVSLNGHPAEPACYDRWFRRIEPIGSFAVKRAGAPVRQVRLYRCREQVYPFPFDALRQFTPEELAVIGRSRGPTIRR